MYSAGEVDRETIPAIITLDCTCSSPAREECQLPERVHYICMSAAYLPAQQMVVLMGTASVMVLALFVSDRELASWHIGKMAFSLC